MQWLAKAPSNIALIKYMGKQNSDHNIAANPSLSYTLNHLQSTVTLEHSHEQRDKWLPLCEQNNQLTLSPAAEKRFLQHLHWLKQQFNFSGSFIVRSANNFPLGCGLASSAASFAALTKCTALALTDLTAKPYPSILQQATWSRQGSGSSCRSFFDGFVLWDNDNIQTIDTPYTNLIHKAIVISQEEKLVSSTDAHLRVCSSPHYAMRAQRANLRLQALLQVLQNQDWAKAYRICWEEFHDMHNLFTTAAQPFHYITAETQHVLTLLEKLWEIEQDGPIVTMDAGPNIHLLYRCSQQALADHFQQKYLDGRYHVI